MGSNLYETDIPAVSGAPGQSKKKRFITFYLVFNYDLLHPSVFLSQMTQILVQLQTTTYVAMT
jgi:hypothetical protein